MEDKSSYNLKLFHLRTDFFGRHHKGYLPNAHSDESKALEYRKYPKGSHISTAWYIVPGFHPKKYTALLGLQQEYTSLKNVVQLLHFKMLSPKSYPSKTTNPRTNTKHRLNTIGRPPELTGCQFRKTLDHYWSPGWVGRFKGSPPRHSVWNRPGVSKYHHLICITWARSLTRTVLILKKARSNQAIFLIHRKAPVWSGSEEEYWFDVQGTHA